MYVATAESLKVAVIEDRDYKQVINRFLRIFHSCPHPSTEISPAETMFNRPMKTLLPQFSVKFNDEKISKQNVKSMWIRKRNQSSRKRQPGILFALNKKKKYLHNPLIPHLGMY